ncbi:hypothetical protein Rhow_002313 [Rhodococcus wratislaviensis]|uniref:Uncharacterized protein n=1 Tax=Rhodococcus wratislaviensis TaxID=44752 RepID=A0A402C5B8_RHOWR|nr:hypothetical protein Rhow_002313 [Rhodococcus wratislaviensis]
MPAERATQALFLAGWAGFRFGDQAQRGSCTVPSHREK